MVEAVNTIKNNQNGNVDSNQGFGSTLRGVGSSIVNGTASVFEGLSRFTGSISNSCINAGMQISSIPYQPVGYGWGWGWNAWRSPWYCGPGAYPVVGIYGYPMYFGPLTGIGVPDSTLNGTTNNVSCGCSCNCGNSGGNSAGNTTGTSSSGGVSMYNPTSPLAVASSVADMSGINTNINTPQTTVPIYNPDSITNAFTNIDRALNPTKYNADGTVKPTATTNDPKEKPLELVDPETGKSRTPMWYRDLATRKEQNKKLSNDEELWYQQYNKLYRTYSPYQLDENLNYKLDSNGQKIETSIYGEILELQHLFARKQRDEIEAYINNCSAEKLAALELHYPMMDFSGGKSLREAIKDACIVSWLEWTGWNTDRCQRIFDKLDEAAAISPTNMKNALYQALENHRMGGFGFDEDRLNKLLAKLEDDKLLRKYVRKEYPGLIGDIGKKWFKNEETENRLRNIFNQ